MALGQPTEAQAKAEMARAAARDHPTASRVAMERRAAPAFASMACVARARATARVSRAARRLRDRPTANARPSCPTPIRRTNALMTAGLPAAKTAAATATARARFTQLASNARRNPAQDKPKRSRSNATEWALARIKAQSIARPSNAQATLARAIARATAIAPRTSTAKREQARVCRRSPSAPPACRTNPTNAIRASAQTAFVAAHLVMAFASRAARRSRAAQTVPARPRPQVRIPMANALIKALPRAEQTAHATARRLVGSMPRALFVRLVAATMAPRQTPTPATARAPVSITAP